MLVRLYSRYMSSVAAARSLASSAIGRSSSNVDDRLKQIIESSNLGQSKINQLEESKKGTDKAATASQPRNNTGTASSGASGVAESRKAAYNEDGLSRLKPEIASKIGDLPSQRQKMQSEFTKALESRLDSVQTTIFRAMRLLNDVTGYSAIEKLKHNIEGLEDQLSKGKEQVKLAKKAYTDAIQERSVAQKEINELLTRKHNWDSKDLERFTQLYRNDHANEQREHKAAEELEKVERLVDATQLELTQAILTRYHEEQIWSDKIRRASTWGTTLLMGINIVLFALATLVVEPWKRRRMVEAFDDKVKSAITELSSQQSGKLDDIMKQTSAQANDTSNDHQARLQIIPFKASLDAIQRSIFDNYRALHNPEIIAYEISKLDLQVLFGIWTVAGAFCGALVYYLWH